jgi:delta14-sterol reductase
MHNQPVEILIVQFFLGRPLNPTIPGFAKWDVKTFTEVRPGLIGWVLLNVSCACEQYIRLGRLTDSMVLVLIFEAYYVVDSLWNEVGRPFTTPLYCRTGRKDT